MTELSPRANPLKGEVAVRTASGAYTLVFSIEALILLEAHFKEDVQAIGKMIQGGLCASDLKAIWCAGLAEYHADLDEKARARVMSEVGIGEALGLVARAFVAAFATGEEGKKPARPPKAAAGTGGRSTGSSSG